MYIHALDVGSPLHCRRTSGTSQRWRLGQRALGAGFLGASLCLLAATGVAAEPQGQLKVTGPHVKDNLAIYFIHGASRKGPVPLTLAEALRANSVTVHETGQVQQLLIENSGDKEVFVQAGDIVKGGRQDRVLTISLLIPPKSGKISIGSYCVEHGRWSRRGAESDKRFESAETAVPSRAAKIAILSASRPASGSSAQGSTGVLGAVPDGAAVVITDGGRLGGRLDGRIEQRPLQRREPSKQQEVWRNVAEIQQKLSSNLSTGVRSALSASSLQLSLEHQKLVEAREKMAVQLMPIGQKDESIIGFAFAINGHINSAEIYPSNGLFVKMWPKLLKSSVTEAIAEKLGSSGAAEPPEPGAISAFLDDAGKGRPETATLEAKLLRERHQSKRALSLSTRKSDGSYVHRSVIAY